MNDDLISRSALIKAFNEAQVEFDEYYKGLGRAKVITDNAPTVESENNAIQALTENQKIRELFDKANDAEDFWHEVRVLFEGE